METNSKEIFLGLKYRNKCQKLVSCHTSKTAKMPILGCLMAWMCTLVVVLFLWHQSSSGWWLPWCHQWLTGGLKSEPTRFTWM